MAILRTQFWRSHLLAAVVIAILATGVIAAFGSLREMVAATAPDSHEGLTPPTDVTSLLRPDPLRSSIGEFVFLNDVRLEAGPAPSLFYAIGASHNKVLVQFGSNKVASGKHSSRMNIQGVIHGMPNPSLARSEWGLSKKASRELAGQPFYIVAKEITLAPRNTR